MNAPLLVSRQQDEYDLIRALEVPVCLTTTRKVTHPLLLQYAHILRPVQLSALQQAYDEYVASEAIGLYPGMVFNLGTGHGKFLVSLCVAKMVGALRPLLYIPASDMTQTKIELSLWSTYIPDLIPDNLTIWTVDSLSGAERENKRGIKRATGYDRLLELNPDIILVDEAQKLKDSKSVRTKRLDRFLASQSKCRLYVLSATLITRKVSDYAHIFRMVYRECNVLPSTQGNMDAMQRKYEDKEDDEDSYSEFIKRKFVEWARRSLQEEVTFRGALRRRVFTSPYMATSIGSSCAMAITFELFKGFTEAVTDNAIEILEESWTLPDETPVVDAPVWAAQCGYMALGFWRKEVITDPVMALEYRNARREWFRVIRKYAKYMNIATMDSPSLIETAAKSGVRLDAIELAAYTAWVAIRDKYDIQYETVWLTKSIIQSIARFFIKQHDNCIFWYNNVDVAEVLQEMGIPCYSGGGEMPSINEPYVGLSISAYCAGKNLQRWNKNAVLQPTSNPGRMEQLVSRTHRQNQQEDVTVYLNISTNKYLRTVMELMNHTQKLSDLYITALKAALDFETVTQISDLVAGEEDEDD